MPLIKLIAWTSKPVYWLTRLAVEVIGAIGYFSTFCVQVLAACLRPPWRVRLILGQAWTLGIKSLPVAMITGLFVGMVIMLQGGYQLAAFNAKSYAAAGASRALCQLMIPIFTALVVGARTSASIAAELGTMRVTEQIDAMEVLDINPRHYLVVPRVIATTLMLPIITLYADLIGLVGGMIIGAFSLQITPRYYWTITLQYLLYSDVIFGLIQPFFYGATMGLCGCYFGFHTRGGAEGVGRATTRAVVFTLILMVLLVYFLSSWFVYIMETLFSSPLS